MNEVIKDRNPLHIARIFDVLLSHRITRIPLNLIFISAAFFANAGESPLPLETVPGIHVNEYIGRWYEIAKFPNRFQKQCVSDTEARYQVESDGTLLVTNRCRLKNGEFDEAVGRARQIGGATSPRLEVRFAPAWLSFLPFVWGDYWVIDLDPLYQWSVVSEPKREYLWILARSPHLDTEVYQGILERLKRKQFQIDRLEKTVHTHSLTGLF